MIKKIKFKLNKTVIKFFITYIAVLIIPLSISVTSSNKASNVIIENTVSSTVNSLSLTSDVVSGYLEHAQMTATSVYLDNYIGILKADNTMESNLSYYYFAKLKENLNSYSFLDDLYIDLFVFFHKYEYAVTPSAIYSYDRFYDNDFKYGDLSEEEWFDTITSSKHLIFLPSESITYQNQDVSIKETHTTKNAITLVFPLSTLRGDDSKGEIVLLINEELIIEALSTSDIGTDGWCAIINDEGQLITSIAGENANQEDFFGYDYSSFEDGFHYLGDEKMLVTTIVSDFNEWRYVTVVPESYILRDVFNLRKFNIIVFVIALLLGFLFSLGFTSINMRPLKELVGFLRSGLNEDFSATENEYDFIKTSINKVKNKNLNLQKRIEAQFPLMRTAIFDSLLNGKVSEASEINDMLLKLGLDLSGSYYAVLIAKILYYPEDFNDIENARVITGSSMIKDSPEKIHLHYLDDDKLVIFYVFNKTDNPNEELMDFSQRVLKNAQNKNEIELVIGIGGIQNDVAEISKCYENALYVIDYLYLGKNIIWYDNLKPDAFESNLYYYTQTIESQLISATKNGNLKEMNALLKKIYYDNFINRKLSLMMGKQLISNLYNTALKTMSKAGCMNLYEDFDISSKNLEDSYEAIIDLFEKICKESDDKRTKHKNKLIKDITAYIDSEYTNSSISLSSVGEHFGLSETWLSHLFKYEMKENFSKYIEKKRIDLACRMLGKKLIKDIAIEVGYNSELTFSRAFKRVTGESPSTYTPYDS